MAMEEERRQVMRRDCTLWFSLGYQDPPKASLRIAELKPWISDSKCCSKGSRNLIVYLIVQICFRIEYFLLI